MTTLQDKFPLPKDNDVTMDVPNHVYTVKGKEYEGSVSSFLKDFFVKFDTESAISGILGSKNINNREYEYFGMNRQNILDHWAKGLNDGTILHSCIEDFYNGIVTHITGTDGVVRVKPLGEVSIGGTFNLQDKIAMYKSIEYGYFKNFLKDYPDLVPYRSELMIYHEELELVGSVDMIYIKPNGNYILADWKRSKRIDTTSFGNKCSKFSGLEHIPDCNYYHYCFQLNIYKFILESKYGMIIDEMNMIVFHPKNKNYVKYIIPNMDREMSIIMANRIKKIKNLT
jgi:hypothetical protein